MPSSTTTQVADRLSRWQALRGRSSTLARQGSRRRLRQRPVDPVVQARRVPRGRIDPASLDTARRERPGFRFDSALPVDEEFDTIVILAVIEHVKDPTGLLAKLSPLLSKAGAMVITTPHPRMEWAHTVGAKVHLVPTKPMRSTRTSSTCLECSRSPPTPTWSRATTIGSCSEPTSCSWWRPSRREGARLIIAARLSAAPAAMRQARLHKPHPRR